MPPVRPSYPSGIDGLNWLTTDDGSVTLQDTHLNECYHSGCGAVSESLLVYVKNSGVLQRLTSGRSTRILEVGVGTGTAMLLTAALANHFATDLDYWAVENHLLPSDLLAQLRLIEHLQPTLSNNHFSIGSDRELDLEAFRCLPQLTQQWTQLVGTLHHNLGQFGGAEMNGVEGQEYGSSPSSQNQTTTIRHRQQLASGVQLNLLLGDILAPETMLPAVQMAGCFDAIYFDPFSPSTHPQLWQESVFAIMFQLLKQGGILSTYCVKSSVRGKMESVGFHLQRVPGPTGGKREVLVAQKPSSRST
jgi:tRNA U34 5-methylaminomethyl-2-thiouridine-forming methyltransferase MnmC